MSPPKWMRRKTHPKNRMVERTPRPRRRIEARIGLSEDCGTKDKILKECAELFYHENFEQTLDEKTHLIGFNNGIFDLNKNQFREGVPKPSVHVYGHRL
jgi:phage/plasmid-associated DNA primase